MTEVSDEAEPLPWEGKLLLVVGQFGEECAKLRDTNPYEDCQRSTPLEQAIVYLATELWDRNFSVTEIQAAFAAAIKAVPSYANGWNRRSDEPTPMKH